MPKVPERELSMGELLEKQRLAKAYPSKNTYTYSIKVGDLWYKIIQAKKTTKSGK